jgi:protein TonB
MPKTLDDIVFENRNKEYGSYWLRKHYARRLLLSFSLTLVFCALLTVGYFWYMNADGHGEVYLLPSSYPSLKSAQGSLMDPKELAAFLKSSSPENRPAEEQSVRQADALRDFNVVEEATPDTFKKPAEDETTASPVSAGMQLSPDSTIFGGYLAGDGTGTGVGSSLDRFPEFPGGLDKVRRFIELTVDYPAQAVKQKINGVVLVSFDVNKLGQVDNIKVEKGIHPMLDSEAVKAVKNMPPWKPGIRHGRPVIVKFVIPVRFMPLS